MRYASIDKCEQVNGKGFGVSLYTQGCPYHCKGCFNQETWDFKGGKEWTQAEEDLVAELMKPDYITRLTILGGEPLVERNIKPLERLLARVKEIYPDKEIWLYTGGIYEEESKLYPELFKYINVLIDGQFIEELRDITLAFRGSSNQRVIRLK